jgi:NAD(P)-dependent dehydrogenase (short-subunit alcohol dehydrogenase family)
MSSKQIPVVIGMDIGTSVVKSAAFSDRGELIALAKRTNTFESPKVNYAECRMEQVWEKVRDILVNNASIVGQVAPVRELDLQEWNRCMAINLTGTMLMSGEALRPMIRQQSGNIINISSNVGKRGLKNRAPYVCSKWAVLGLTQTLALETAEFGIRVNAICPGPVLTERLRGAMEQMAEARGMTVEEIAKEWTSESPMKRFVTVEEVAKTALFLASGDSSSLTGQSLNVSAGAYMS